VFRQRLGGRLPLVLQASATAVCRGLVKVPYGTYGAFTASLTGRRSLIGFWSKINKLLQMRAKMEPHGNFCAAWLMNSKLGNVGNFSLCWGMRRL
jgi:hypothetical protein